MTSNYICSNGTIFLFPTLSCMLHETAEKVIYYLIVSQDLRTLIRTEWWNSEFG